MGGNCPALFRQQYPATNRAGQRKRQTAARHALANGRYTYRAALSKELGLIQDAEYDARLTRLMGTLNRLMLTDTRTPWRLYSSQTATLIDFSGNPVRQGWSARDMARLMLCASLQSVSRNMVSIWTKSFCGGISVRSSITRANCGHLPCRMASRWCVRSCVWAKANMPRRRFICGIFSGEGVYAAGTSRHHRAAAAGRGCPRSAHHVAASLITTLPYMLPSGVWLGTRWRDGRTTKASA